jgi:DNA glycosylase AlkZ-like
MPAEALDRRALNRALLARQHLLTRSPMAPQAMIGHLIAMQAQNPLDPYIALWSRLGDFQAADLSTLIESRRAVRLGLMRTTLHLTSAEDALQLWPVFQPVLRRAWASSSFRKQIPDTELDAIVAASRDLLEAEPQTTAALGKRLRERWPDSDATSLGYVARFMLPIVQLPPRAVWGKTAPPTWTTLEACLGRPLATVDALDLAVIRYLGAFGPATVADIRTWSWLTGLREVIERLRPRLVTFHDDAGRELFDLPDAPRPDPETPAPPRFLPEYDNLTLSHDDRSRVIGDAAIGRLTGWVGTFLVDGFIAGQWRIERAGHRRTMILQPFEPLPDAHAVTLVDEAEHLLAFDSPTITERVVEFGIARAPGASRG